MTIWLEGNRSFFLGAPAGLVDNDREMAASWATPHVVPNPAVKYVLGRFVESDRANSNRQVFSLAGLQMGRPSIQNAPMNLNHIARRVVGTFVASDLIYPTSSPETIDQGAQDVEAAGDSSGSEGEQAAAVGLNPYIEALGVFWKYYFPDEYQQIEKAHAEGALFYSMEAIPGRIQCTGVGGCGQEFEYAGRQSNVYCPHLNEGSSDKLLVDPHFTAGALLIPPVQPGWANADVHSLVAQYSSFADQVYAGVASEFPHLSGSEWEALMGQILTMTAR